MFLVSFVFLVFWVRTFPARLAALGECLISHELVSKEQWDDVSATISHDLLTRVPYKIVDRMRKLYKLLPFSVYLNFLCSSADKKGVKYDSIMGFLKV